MRVVRTLLGILLITFSVLSFLAGGGLVAVLDHEGPDGAYGASLSGLDTTGYAIVVPDVGALLKKQAPFARSSGGTLRVAASIGGAPAFVGLAPSSAVATYLGPVPYGRVDTIHVGLHGLPVTVIPVAAPNARATAIPGGAPDRQRFWLARGAGGALAWSPTSGPAAAPGTALVIMRADGAAGVHVTATAELRPGGLVGTAATLLGAGMALAMVAIALLLWPSRRREIVYVVEPAQVPEIAARLGVPAGPAFADAAATAGPAETQPVEARSAVAGPTEPEASEGGSGAAGPTETGAVEAGSSEVRAAAAGPTETRAAGAKPAQAGPTRAEPAAGAGSLAFAASETDLFPVVDTGIPEPRDPEQAAEVAPRLAAKARATACGVAPAPPGATLDPEDLVALFADPKTRPTSLTAVLLLPPLTPAGSRGTYRSSGAPPSVTPSFRWSPPTAGEDGEE